MSDDTPTMLYRYDSYPRYDDTVEVAFETFYAVKRTRKGVWVQAYGYTKNPQGHKFVLLSGTKRFAYPTKAEALESFIARKKRQIEYLNQHLANARMALATALEMKE